MFIKEISPPALELWVSQFPVTETIMLKHWGWQSIFCFSGPKSKSDITHGFILHVGGACYNDIIEAPVCKYAVKHEG